MIWGVWGGEAAGHCPTVPAEGRGQKLACGGELSSACLGSGAQPVGGDRSPSPLWLHGS